MHCPGPQDSGISLIETIAALVLFALVALGGAAMLLTGAHVSSDTRNRSQSATLAGSKIEAFRSNASFPCAWQSPLPAGCKATASVVPPAVTTSTQVVGTTTYTIRQSTQYVAKSTPQSACDASVQGGSAGVQPVLLVSERITWPNMRGTKPTRSSTILAPPVGAFSNNTGAIDIGVVNSQNHPVPGVAVTVTSAANATSSFTTDDNGCALAAFLTPGSYTVRVSQPGYVDNQENSTSTQVLGATTGNVTTATFFYDQAATVSATFAPAASWPATATFQYPAGLPVTVANSGLAGTGTYLLPNGTAGSPVYPYASGYSVWAGRCPEANPNAVTSSNSPLYPAAPAPTTVNAPAGQAVGANVPLYPLTISAKDGASKAMTFTLTESAGGAKIPCTSPFATYPLPGATLANNTTQTYVVAVPLGVYSLQATDGSSSKTVNNVKVDLSGTSASVTL